jgi:hypothetical protein
VALKLLDDSTIREGLKLAWLQSQPGSTTPHEEGGFIVQASEGSLAIERWPTGILNKIEVPDHSEGRYRGNLIVATFHTHPNSGPAFQQQPSLTDIRAVRLDPDLRHFEYAGEFVISVAVLYQILPDGVVLELGDTRALLNLT